MMRAVDADFAAAVDFLHARARLDQHDVAVRGARRIAVRHRPRQLFRQVEIETAAAGDVQLLHAQADA